MRGLLDEAGIDFVGGAYAVEAGEVNCSSSPTSPWLPTASRSPAPARSADRRDPTDGRGVRSVDDHCDVHGTDAVFAAGDITSFPIKQGGIAAQQAVAAAEAIAVLAGAALVAASLPASRIGLLLTGRSAVPAS